MLPKQERAAPPTLQGVKKQQRAGGGFSFPGFFRVFCRNLGLTLAEGSLVSPLVALRGFTAATTAGGWPSGPFLFRGCLGEALPSRGFRHTLDLAGMKGREE